MTARIYYTDPYCRQFGAVVTRALQHEGRPAALLDRTAFYPTSGGQPFDIGRINDIDVIEAIEAADDVVHVLAAPVAEGEGVHGEIDWDRRFDHMQQHTGQHVLSAAFDRLFDNQTTSFHMGAELSTIDLANEMSRDLMSPFCPGRTLADCSSPDAAAVRQEIREALAVGEQPDAIRTRIEARFGDHVVGVPRQLLGWLLPILVLCAGAAGLVWVLRRAVRRPAPAARVLSPELEARLARELDDVDSR